ncbi:histidine phosphatase family protein, partial [Prochlorococcus sp. AH-716-E13]|nr:histidine phosphatase family protein [Prochlorococcus sp. AH-716-E13]
MFCFTILSIEKEALSRISFDKIYSSPLARAAETAKTIKKKLKRD